MSRLLYNQGAGETFLTHNPEAIEEKAEIRICKTTAATTKYLHSKMHHKQNKKTNYKQGKNISSLYCRKGSNVQWCILVRRMRRSPDS